MSYQEVTITQEGISLTRLVWRFMSRKPAGYVEQVLEANPGVLATQPYLPIGLKIKLPIVDITDDTPARQVVRLWD